MVSPIQTLLNMEYGLYGNSGYGLTNAPSYANNYMMQSPYNNTYYYNYPYNSVYQTTPMQTIQTPNGAQAWGGGTYVKANPQTDLQNTSFQGLSQQDLDNLSNYYANNNVLEEGFKGAATGGLTWMAWEHAQSLFHPRNAFFSKNTGARVAENAFKNVSKEFMKNNQVLSQEAYTAIQQATRDTGSKWFYSGWLRNPIGKVHPGDDKKIFNMVDELKSALERGDTKNVALKTSELQAARGMDGKLIRKSKRLSVSERLANKTKNGSIAKKAAELESIASGNFGALVKNSFKTNFIGWMGFEMLFGAGKILKGFQKDTGTGLKQTGQTAGKAAFGAAGWCLGRAAGTFLGAKAGTALGTAIAPGIGTLIGGLIGFTVGSIGMWAGHKLGNAIFGNDVADKAEAQELTQTPEGQAQLIQFALQKAQEGKPLDVGTQQAVQKALSLYA